MLKNLLMINLISKSLRLFQIGDEDFNINEEELNVALRLDKKWHKVACKYQSTICFCNQQSSFLEAGR